MRKDLVQRMRRYNTNEGISPQLAANDSKINK